MSTLRDNRLFFEIKNNNRKRYFIDCDDPKKKIARAMRRSNNGAFGRLKAHDTKSYNMMIIGTSLGPKI